MSLINVHAISYCDSFSSVSNGFPSAHILFQGGTSVL